MTAQSSGQGFQAGQGHVHDHDLKRARTLRTVSIVLAIAAFSVLVVGFGLAWPPYYQVPAGLTAWLAIEWQRNCSRRIKALKDGGAA